MYTGMYILFEQICPRHHSQPCLNSQGKQSTYMLLNCFSKLVLALWRPSAGLLGGLVIEDVGFRDKAPSEFLGRSVIILL